MEKTETIKKTNIRKTLSSDPYYFKYIFKKTEKIVCAVFYILHTSQPESGDEIVRDTEASAKRLLEVSLMVLERTPEEAEGALLKIGHRLIELESKLRILNAARLLSNELMLVFQNEIDLLFRAINNYAPESVTNPFLREEAPLPLREKQAQSVRNNQTAIKDTTGSISTKTDRRTRVLSILKEKGQASIKDVSDAITECSEKTIQRELNNLIKDGLAVREGERRWSVYRPA